jgi:hypothetical protein
MHELVAAGFPASRLAAFAFDFGSATISRSRNPMKLPKTKYARSGSFALINAAPAFPIVTRP